SATLLTLIVIPVLYYFVESRTGKNVGTKRPPAVAGSIIILMLASAGLIFTPDTAVAQQKPVMSDTLKNISIQKAVQKAKASYPAVKSAELAVKSSKAMKKTAWDLGTTQIFTGKEEV